MTDLNLAPVAPAADAPAKKSRSPKAAPVKTLSIAQLARELKIDEKIARRRMRANVARTKPAKTPDVIKNPSRKNARYEYADNATNRAMLTAIIKTPE